MRAIPGMTVICPADANETRKAVFAAAEMQGPVYLRLARLASPVFEEDYPFEIGKANVMRDGTDVAVFATGLMVSAALEAAKLLEAEGRAWPSSTSTPSSPLMPSASWTMRRSAAA